MSVSKKLRFEIFKRDLFTCQYCGKTPPAVVLELDHIHPVSRGGKDVEENLNTACFECNRGKAAGLITTVIASTAAKAEKIAEAEEQVRQYQKLSASKRRRETMICNEIQKVFTAAYPNYELTTSFKKTIKTHFIPRIPKNDLIEYMELACDRMIYEQRAIKYFCGICWRVIKDGER
jgi:HNH endonuclease